MRTIRGTLIICDQVYQDRSGKFIIAGTYTTWQTQEDELRLHGIHAYLRLQVEQPGSYPCSITMVDRMAPPNHPPMLRLDTVLPIAENQIPIFECAVHLPDLQLRAPTPRAQRAPGTGHGIRTLVSLVVKDEDVASCPLDFVFLGPATGPAKAG
jgi:hypothetical protein